MFSQSCGILINMKLSGFRSSLVFVVPLLACGDDPIIDPDEICGPCGSIETGQLSISGNARLDGFFAAVAQAR